MPPVADLLAPEVPPAVRRRGERYAAEGRVRILESHVGRGLHASVQGTRTYHVFLEVDGGDLTPYCTCDAFVREGVCKHYWAVVLAAEQRLGSAQLGKVLGLRALAAPAPPRPAWDVRLDGLAQSLKALPFQPPPRTGVADRWWLVLDASASRRESGLILEIWCERTLRSGRRKDPEKLRWSSVLGRTTAPPAVRALVERLRALELRSYHPWGNPAEPTVLKLGFEWLGDVLPGVMRDHEVRLRLADDREPGPPLAFDPDPWQLRFGFEPGGPKPGDLVLQGWFERAGERKELSEMLLGISNGYVFFGARMARFEPTGAFAWLTNLHRDGPLAVPAADRPAFLRRVLALPAPPPFDLGPLADRPGRPEGVLALEGLNPQAQRAGAWFDYEGARVGLEDPTRHVVSARDGKLLARDAAAEARLLEALAPHGVERVAPEWTAAPFKLAGEGLAARLEGLIAAGWQVRVQDQPLRAGGTMSVRVRASGVDWFDLEGEARFDQAALKLPAILEAARAGRGLLTFEDGSAALIPAEWATRLAALGALTEGSRQPRVSRAQVPLLDVLLEDVPGADLDREFEEARRRWRSLSGVAPRPEPEGFCGRLRPYQQEGLGWLCFLEEAGLGGCLADDMGLGKTVQVLAWMLGRARDPKRTGPVLVVAPLSVLPGWVEQAEAFAPALRVVLYHGPGRARCLADLGAVDVLVTTYGTLARDVEPLAALALDAVVLDEAQNIKNAQSQAAQAARRLRAPRRLALTGTPVENHLADLHSLFQFLNPGLLGSATQLSRALGGGRPTPEALGWLARALKPVILRRTKEQVLADLPAKSEQVLHCPLPAAQRKAYEEVREHYRASVLARVAQVGMAQSKLHVLEALLRLRQAACHPGLLDPARQGEPCGKLEILLPMLQEVAETGHKALVFSQFTSFLALLRPLLDAAGLGHVYLDGKTRKRAEVIRRFQEDPAQHLFLISLKAGGTGLNLTAADYVFLLDPWWNPAVEAQAVDRAHRIGQARKVMVYRLIGEDTIEAKVQQLQEQKRELVRTLLGGVADAPLTNITREDLERLLA